MPRNRVKTAEKQANTFETPSEAPEKGAEKSIGKPTRKPNAVTLFAAIHSLQSTLRKADPKIAKTSDRLLASIGYPAKLLGHIFAIRQLSSLSSAISDYRTLSRVVSTPATLEYALDLLVYNKNPDRIDRYIDYVQGISGLLYQIFEDIAYLGGKNVIKVSAKRQADMWVWSSIAWAIDVVLEVLKVPYHKYVLRKEISYRKLAVNLAWLPLTYHWSTYNGVFNEGIVGLLGTAACWPNMVYQWRTA